MLTCIPVSGSTTVVVLVLLVRYHKIQIPLLLELSFDLLYERSQVEIILHPD